MRVKLSFTFTFGFLLAVLTLALLPATVGAQSPVEDCSDDVELRADIVASQVVTFTCGPATIPMTMPITIDKYVEIDGGSVITLTGGGVTHHFEVGEATGTLRLSNIALVNGAGPTATVPITAPAAGSIVNMGVLLLENATLLTNNALSEGGAGAIYSDGYLEIRDSRISNNSGGASGGIVTLFEAKVYDTLIEGNNGQESGAILARAPVILQRVEVRNNVGQSGAGAISVSGDPIRGAQVQVIESTIDGNDGHDCGAIRAVNGVVTIQASTISRNFSSGGATLCLTSENRDVLSLFRSTVSLNQSQKAAIVLGGLSYAYMQSSTIVFNRPSISDVGGILVLEDNLVVGFNTILYGNGDVQCGNGMLENSNFSFSVLGDTSCPELDLPDFDPRNRYGDPMLGPLADNGGYTETHMPSDTSIALEMGAVWGLFTGCEWNDQRGVPRWFGLCDAGSVEAEIGTYSFLPIIQRP